MNVKGHLAEPRELVEVVFIVWLVEFYVSRAERAIEQRVAFSKMFLHPRA